MAWLLRHGISLVDRPVGRWSDETVAAIRRANAEVVARYSKLPPADPNYVAEGDAPAGIPIPELDEPRKYQIEKIGASIPDALTTTLVNERIRAIVEQFEPGVHQFSPVVVIFPDGTHDQCWWNMRACHRLDSIDVAQSEGVYGYYPRKNEFPEWYYYRSNMGSRNNLAVNRSIIGNISIWYDWRFQNFFHRRGDWSEIHR